MLITILTPTFNRAVTLPKLYESLCSQTSKSFEWLIIDDGSTDQTNEIVESFDSKVFPIKYYFKENGGKHTALNFSHPYICGDLVVIVDSDDFLDNDAVEIILGDWQKYRERNDIGILNYLKKTLNGVSISKPTEVDYLEANDISYRVNNSIAGDRCEVVRTEAFLKHKMPVFEGERFMGEGWLWKKISLDYDTVYINKAIYNAEYLEGGLSKNGRLFRMRNPYGMMENCRGFFIPKVSAKIKIKELLLYGVYGLCSDLAIGSVIRQSTMPIRCSLMMPFSFILYKIWCKKFGFVK